MDQNEYQDSCEVFENESKESEEEVQEIKSELITKPKTKSAIWNFFHVESDSERHRVTWINQFAANVWNLVQLRT